MAAASVAHATCWQRYHKYIVTPDSGVQVGILDHASAPLLPAPCHRAHRAPTTLPRRQLLHCPTLEFYAAFLSLFSCPHPLDSSRPSCHSGRCCEHRRCKCHRTREEDRRSNRARSLCLWQMHTPSALLHQLRIDFALVQLERERLGVASLLVENIHIGASEDQKLRTPPHAARRSPAHTSRAEREGQHEGPKSGERGRGREVKARSKRPPCSGSAERDSRRAVVCKRPGGSRMPSRTSAVDSDRRRRPARRASRRPADSA